MRVLYFIPWATSDVGRLPGLPRIIRAIAHQAFSSTSSEFAIQVHVNGDECSAVARAVRSLVSVDKGFPVRISSSRVADKVVAVLYGAGVAADGRYDALVILDNDIILTPDAIPLLLSAYSDSVAQVACAYKAPLITRSSSEFQQLYSYAVQASFAHSLFPKRPTGSLYAVHPSAVSSIFLVGHAESDRLSLAGATGSKALVLSSYPRDFEAEVDRRVRHWTFAERHGYQRMHSDPEFGVEAGYVSLPTAVDAGRFRASLAVWNDVHGIANQRAADLDGVVFASNMGGNGMRSVARCSREVPPFNPDQYTRQFGPPN